MSPFYVDIPTIMITSQDGTISIPFCPKWKELTVQSFCSESDRETVEVAIVPGPLKARVITKETVSNVFLEPVRYGVWNKLRKHEMFLIDGPPCVEDLPKRLPGEIYVSGDYTAATDGFHPEVSEAICDEIGWLAIRALRDELLPVHDDSDEFSEEEVKVQAILDDCHEAIRTTMTHKKIVYPDGSEIRQERGQLMGNLLSFPVLCIYNYCVFQIAHEKFELERLKGKVSPLSTFPLQKRVRINGDDILFPATMQRYEKWRAECDRLGMELNVLKTQISETECSLNSQLFEEEEGILVKTFSEKIYGPDVDCNQRVDLRRRELDNCGASAPGVSIWLGSSWEPVPEKRLRSVLNGTWPSVSEFWTKYFYPA